MLISIDPAKSAGIVEWEGKKPFAVSTLAPIKASVAKKEFKDLPKTPCWVLSRLNVELGERNRFPFMTQGDALRWVINSSGKDSVIVMEEGFGASTTTVKQHAFLRGYIACICDELGARWYEVNVSEWRKVVGPKHGITFPSNSELAKARAADIAAELLPGVVFDTNDETDALMVGLWALYTGTAK